MAEFFTMVTLSDCKEHCFKSRHEVSFSSIGAIISLYRFFKKMKQNC